MKNAKELKSLVQEKYSEIALQDKTVNAASCCGAGPVSGQVYTIMSDDYTAMEGYNADADLGLGCGLPTQFAKIQKGDTVIDLGSGAGNDAFIARHETGPEGKVIGIDFTPAMIQKARENSDKLGYNNVEFREGDLENMPVSNDVADVIVSNCVLNLVPDKTRVLSEIYRVLKPGGHFSISDIVLVGDLPESLQKDAEMYAGCISGALQKEDYLQKIKAAGFQNIQVQKEKVVLLPDDILTAYLSPEEISAFAKKENGIFSVTVYAEKPGTKKKIQLQTLGAIESSCCTPGGGCC
ncbi:MAG TPA: arsenite S-adenosylmethyltransferase [Bacteroidetes bacterium]|nr:arsenite S-adenosylmethyltransferase [Bacteroidota bacterium]